MSGPNSGWQERIWRANNVVDIARGNVLGSSPFSVFGERVTSGSAQNHILWETGMPNTLTVPQSVQMAFVSTGADVRRFKMLYLDGDLLSREEIVTLNGTTPVLTQAEDIRFINLVYSLDGTAATTVTVTSGGIQYARVNPNEVQFNKAVHRVAADKKLMITSLYAGASSASSDARTVVKIRTSFFNGDSFAEQGILHPVGGIAIQDGAVTLPFGPFPIPSGEIVAFAISSDKGVQALGGFFGWIEDA